MNPSGESDPFVWPDDPHFKDFPKHLPEDCVEYTLHVLDSTLTAATLRSRLLEVQRAAEKLQKDLLKGYVWQREAFSLSLSEPFGTRLDPSISNADLTRASDGAKQKAIEDSKIRLETTPSDPAPVPLHLRGRTSYGDSLADEWLIVYLLRELSNQFLNTWTRVWDTDGEFLLIEAANALPRWLNPEVADHRVWLHLGKISIIPLRAGTKKATIGLDRDVSLPQALEYLQQNVLDPSNPKYSITQDPKIDTEAFTRLRNYPEAISLNLHTSTVTLPRRLAYLIHRQPSWVAPAIEAFYLRDPIVLKLLQVSPAEARQQLSLPPQDFVDVTVRFQRVGFAQLRGQEFPPPRVWNGSQWPVPADDVDAVTVQRRRDTGMKLTCGFEMLLGDPQTQSKQSVREMKLLLEDLEAGEEMLPDDGEVESWRQQGEEDSEQWMDVNYEDLERTLKGQATEGIGQADEGQFTGMSKEAEPRSGFGDQGAGENLRLMVQRFEDFLKDEDGGGIEGVDDDGLDEMDHDDASDADNSEEDTDQAADEDTADKEPDFSDAQLQEMIVEMKSMGLKPPVLPSDADDEIRKALLALSDFKAPDIAATKSKDKANEHADADDIKVTTRAGPNTQLNSSEDLVKGESVEQRKRPLWADPDLCSSDEEGEIEEIPRNHLPPQTTARERANSSSSSDLDPFDVSDDVDFAQLQQMLDAELRSSGALDHDAASSADSASVQHEPDPRYNLVKHLLESYKSQLGGAGPAGNMMGLMGLAGLPRDGVDALDPPEDQERGRRRKGKANARSTTNRES